MGVSMADAGKKPTIVFGQYVADDEHSKVENIIHWGDDTKVFVTIAMSQELSPLQGLQMFVPGSHVRGTTIPHLRTISENKARITLNIGWAIVWAGSLGYMWPKGGGGLFANLVYQKTD
jgi:hypothetical protein